MIVPFEGVSSNELTYRFLRNKTDNEESFFFFVQEFHKDFAKKISKLLKPEFARSGWTPFILLEPIRLHLDFQKETMLLKLTIIKKKF